MKPNPNFLWSSYGKTHVGKVRNINQDALANIPDKSLWVVADGMGGHKEGEFASTEIINTLKQFEPEKTFGLSIKKIYLLLQEVNQLLINKAALNNDDNEIIGSTVVILYANQQHCVILWSGDSRIYLFRRGELKQITRDHNNESMLLAEKVDPSEIQSHPYAQILTHAIGGEPDIYLDAQIQEIRDKDIFLLCSDGLNKEISDNEIEDILRQQPYHDALDHLINLALHRGARDNTTVILTQASLITK